MQLPLTQRREQVTLDRAIRRADQREDPITALIVLFARHLKTAAGSRNERIHSFMSKYEIAPNDLRDLSKRISWRAPLGPDVTALLLARKMRKVASELGKIPVELLPGDTLDEAISQLISRAGETGLVHTARFNDIHLVARPGDDPATVRKPFYDQYESPKAIARSEKAERKAAAEFEAERAKATVEIEKLRGTPARTGEALIANLQLEAAANEYRAYDFYAICNLRHPEEIASFTSHYVERFPDVAAKNIRFSMGDRTVLGTEKAWEQALAAVEAKAP